LAVLHFVAKYCQVTSTQLPALQRLVLNSNYITCCW